VAGAPALAQDAGPSDGTPGATHLRMAEELLVRDPDSALVHALAAEGRLAEFGTALEQAQVLMVVGDAYQQTGEMPEALLAYQRAQTMVDERSEGSAGSGVALARTDIQLKVGVLHVSMRDLDKAMACYNEALRILDAAQGIPPEEVADRKVRAFNNIAGVYVHRSEFATALPYFQQAVELDRPLDRPRNEASLNNNIGICYMEMGRYALANEYFLKALAVRTELGDVRGQAQVLNNLGKNQTNFGNFKEARNHFAQALALGRRIGSSASMAISLESLSLVYDTLGDHKAALAAHREFKLLNDSSYSTESRLHIARLEDAFRRDKEKKVFELETKRKDAENARQRAWNVALVGALFFLLLTAFLLFAVMRTRVRNSALEQEKLRLESEKLEAEQRILKESLEHKDRELTAKALFLLNKNELIAHIAERLLKAKSAFKEENQRIVQEIVRDLQASQDEHNWQEFEAHFTRVHSTFYHDLQERFPALTPNERKLCAFLRLNMSTKDISAITHQTVNSITVARSRLRKKLGIEGEDVHLIDLLQSI
jgi:hypothetical protein